MVREFNITQERRVQPQQHQTYKVTKNIAPTPTTYSLRSRGTPAKGVERPTRVRKVSAKVAENEKIEATQAQLATTIAVEAQFKPMIETLVS